MRYVIWCFLTLVFCSGCSMKASLGVRLSSRLTPVAAPLTAPTAGSYVLKTPSLTNSKSLTPTLTLSGVVPGSSVSFYADSSCTTLITTEVAPSSTFDYVIHLLYGSTTIYTTASFNGQTTACASTGVTYSSNFATSAGFPIGRVDGDFESGGAGAVDAYGNIYVASMGQIFKYNKNGYFQSSFGSFGSGHGQIFYPSSLALDSAGHIFLNDYNHNRVQEFGADGTLILEFGSTGSGAGQFSQPMGIATDSAGNIYVADTQNNRVQKFDATGSYLGQFGSAGSGAGQLSSPNAVVVDASGDIFVADSGNGRVEKFDSSFAYLSQIGTFGSGAGQLFYPTSAVLDTAGNILVGDSYYHGVQKFDASTGAFASAWSTASTGAVIGVDSAESIFVLVNSPVEGLMKFDSSSATLLEIAGPGTAAAELCYNISGLAVSSSGQIVEFDGDYSRIQTFNSAGVYQSSFPLAGQYGDPDAMIETDSAGNFYVGRPDYGYVDKYDHTGTLLFTFGSALTGSGQFYALSGVAVDASGNIYAVDGSNNRVEKFNSSGSFVSSFGTSGSGNGQFSWPSGITVDSSGNIYVIDNGNSRVQKFDSSGTYLSQFGSSGSGAGQFNGAWSIGTDSSGNVYVYDQGNTRIETFDNSGSFITQFALSPTEAATRLAVDPVGNIFVSSRGKIRKYNSSGVEQSQ